MSSVSTADVEVQRVWRLCREAYRQNGYILRFPKNTDPRKTYQWRYVEKLIQKFREWEFDADTVRSFITLAAEYQSQRRLIRKGLSVMLQDNMLQIVYKRLQEQESLESATISSIQKTFDFLQSRAHGESIYRVLVTRDVPNRCNITEWYETQRINELYLASSQSCTEALNHIAQKDPDQRILLPSRATLFNLRSSMSRPLKSQVEAIIGEDWRKL